MTALYWTIALIAAEPTVPPIDCGIVRAGPPLVRTFALTNPGPTMVTLTLLGSSCGCLHADLSTRRLGVGETANLTVTINTLSSPEGRQRWTTRVAWQPDGADHSAVVECELVAQLQRDILVEPTALVLIGCDPVALTETIRIRDRRSPSFRSLTAHCNLDVVHVEAVQRDADGWLVRVAVRPAAPMGEWSGTVTLETDDADYRTIAVPIRLVTRPRAVATAYPNSVVLSPTTPTAIVQVRAADGPVEIASADAGPGLDCRWAEGSHAVGAVRVALSDAELRERRLLTIQLRQPATTVTVPIETKSTASVEGPRPVR